MKKRALAAGLLMSLVLTACSSDDDPASSSKTSTTPVVDAIEYSIDVIDIDGESLGKYSISTNDESSLFQDLLAKYDVEYTESQYGPFISSINDSIVDNNYFMAIYINGQQASTGVDGIKLKDNDEIEFKVECFNTEFDETDLLVDKTIYGFYKDAKQLFKNETVVDYYLYAATNKAIDSSYDVSLEFVPEAVKTTVESTNLTDLADMSSIFKAYQADKALDNDLLEYKTLIEERNYEPLEGTYVASTNAFYYLLMEAVDANPTNHSKFEDYLLEYMKAPEAGDTGCMAAPALVLFDEFTDYKETFINVQTPTFKSTGVDPWGYGANACSTAQAIIAFSAMGEDIRDDKYAVDGTDIVEALLTYFTEDYVVLDYLGENPDLAFNTPQSMAALVIYKMFRDSGSAVNIYA